MSTAAFGEDTGMRMEALRRQAQISGDTVEGISIRQLRGATEFRGRRDRLLASGYVLPEWLPGQRQRATLRAHAGGRDVFARRLEDGRFCVLVMDTPKESAARDRAAFRRFMSRILGG